MNSNDSVDVTIPCGYLDIILSDTGHILTSSVDDGLTNISPIDINDSNTALQLQEHSYPSMESNSCKQSCTNWIVYLTEVLLMYAVDSKTRCIFLILIINTPYLYAMTTNFNFTIYLVCM